MKEISGKNKLKEVLKEFPQAEIILTNLGVNKLETSVDMSLVEIAIANKVPLTVLLNNLGKKLGLKVVWPKVEGVSESYQDNFSKSTGLRKGRPKGIKKILAVHSGKGGVGKSTLAILLASHMAGEGKKVGLLDLDVDCPNIMRALGVSEKHQANQGKKIEPIPVNGFKVISMGAIQSSANQAIMWRGPIIAKAIEQLFHDSEWGELDVLVVDFPPGTGEAPLTFFNITKPDGVMIVTTPQITALDDASKAVDMCNKLGVKVIGVVENMCGEIFGDSAPKVTKKITGAKWIAALPLSKKMTKPADFIATSTKEMKNFCTSVEKIIFEK